LTINQALMCWHSILKMVVSHACLAPTNFSCSFHRQSPRACRLVYVCVYDQVLNIIVKWFAGAIETRTIDKMAILGIQSVWVM
jgi:hypothetical protein